MLTRRLGKLSRNTFASASGDGSTTTLCQMPKETPVSRHHNRPGSRPLTHSLSRAAIAATEKARHLEWTHPTEAGTAGLFVSLMTDSCSFPGLRRQTITTTQLANLVLDPRAGYLFVDFDSGSLLQLTGTVAIDWDSEALSQFPGARRLVTLDIEEVVEQSSVLSLRWESDAEAVRTLRLVAKVSESEDVTSFIFEARDGGPLASFAPGQHLPIELDIPGAKETVRRNLFPVECRRTRTNTGSTSSGNQRALHRDICTMQSSRARS